MLCLCVWAEREDEIMGFHCATGGRKQLEYSEHESEMLLNEAGVNADERGNCTTPRCSVRRR